MSPTNQPNISKREWFRWEDEAPNEPTSTLVLTSAENRFVDIRIFTEAPDAKVFEGIRPFTQLDWAFAGTSSSTPTSDEKGQPTTHSVWKHFVDSRSLNPEEEVQDEGDMVPTLNDKTIERGKMRNPATNLITPYEECWSTVPATPTSKESKKVEFCVMVCDDGKTERGMVVRVGQFCQGIVRSGDGLALERWSWGEEGGWKREVRMGDLFVPCGVVIEGRCQRGDEVRYQEQRWRVVEMGVF